ncbi:hypothetical protein DL991_36280 [Amycolatopsis sp. WAC 01375]|uniref:Uncharacterized protein n=2 Tax=Amycolatopsis TaxID=1813 RepID=A0A2P2G230_AMYLU|nr:MULTISPECIES: hypothetical protein [Amycolatopsis]AUI63307.1 hypothetical protein BKN51_37620 [Amycolatopsis sp. BJA-103]KFU83025.1 hypothetical protein BB31_00625 [Amycolatopsis lurida NRRL 2430]PNE19151.1 hypothetical protein B1H26_15325 [Amycolatopsis sp. BJA-103]QXV60012.1 hypothetical protein CVV72_25405 [Amycolatopsis sp. TNS106]RSM65662.1 hypothetical protein DMH03_00405 [Amycolatopsis sp. WAC 01376]
MSVQGKKVVQMGGVRRRGSACVSPKALYARPMALRNLYTDAGSIIRRGQAEAVAAHQENAR